MHEFEHRGNKITENNKKTKIMQNLLLNYSNSAYKTMVI